MCAWILPAENTATKGIAVLTAQSISTDQELWRSSAAAEEESTAKLVAVAIMHAYTLCMAHVNFCNIVTVFSTWLSVT